MSPSRREDPGRPVLLSVAVIAVLAEAAALAGTAIWWLVEALSDQLTAVGVALVALAVAAAAGLVALARGLHRGRRGARGPLITWQLLQAATAVTVIEVVVGWAAVMTLVAAAGVGVTLLSPPVTRYLTPQPAAG